MFGYFRSEVDKTEHYDISAEFDIEGLEVFSIERIKQDTVISYYRDSMEHEWHIATTDEQHVKFVTRFTNKLKERYENANQVS